MLYVVYTVKPLVCGLPQLDRYNHEQVFKD